MSYKAFYQTFYQTDQLFRRADDVLAFPPLVPESTGSADAVIDLVEAPVVPMPDRPVIVDPVVPVPRPIARQAESVPVPQPDQSVSSAGLNEPETPASAAPLPIEPIAVLPTPAVPTVVAPTVVVPTPDEASPVVETPGEVPTQPAETDGQQVVRRPATPLLSQKVLILVDEDLLPSDLLFLEKILKAVNLDVAGVDLLNIHGTKTIDFAEVLAGKYIHHFFTFGVPFTRLNLDILMDRYQPVRFDGITFLMADPLPVIEADVVLKKKLWEALKKVFLWR